MKFDKDKISEAILKAFAEVDKDIGEDAYKIANEVSSFVEAIGKDMGVEEIQDIVEKMLMATTRKDVAKAYIIYRSDRSRARARSSNLMKRVRDKVSASDIENQNANVDEKSFGGRFGAVASEVLKEYALDELMSDMARQNHLNNEIYVHDLDHYPLGDHNCMSIPFDDLLANGFNTRQTDVRPAQSANTALQLTAVIFQLQSLQQFGGVSATHLDWTMVPYIRKSFYKHYMDGLKYIEHLSDDDIEAEMAVKEGIGSENISIEDETAYCYEKSRQYALDMTIREVNQAVEGMYHNLNTLQSRSGNQLPFTSINYGTCTFPEGRMLTKALLDISIKGNGKLHRTPIFPCGIFQMKIGVNRKPSDPNYDLYRLALKSTSLRLYPNYANCDWTNAAGYDENDPRTYFSTMGCRTANLLDINGLGQLKDGRGNICPVTIILPTLAMEAKSEIESCVDIAHDEQTIAEGFMNLLDQKIHEAKDMLIERYEYICSQSIESAQFMYENNVIAGFDGKTIESAMRHGTLVIGQLGLAETLQILFGYDHRDPRGMDFAKRIEQLFKDRCAEFKKEYSLNFGVYYTPEHKACCLRGLAS